MKKNIIKYFLIAITIPIIIILYLTIVGLETNKFNKLIKEKFSEKNNKLNLELKKVNLTLDPLNFKINAKTIGGKIFYNKKIIELENITTQLSIHSLIKNKIVSSNIKISSKSILIKDLISIIRAATNKPELFLVERLVKKGNIIADLELNFDEDGKIRKDFKINGLVKNGKVNLLKDYEINKIDFIFNIENSIFDFQDINFETYNRNFFSKNLKIIQNKEDFFFKGEVSNKNFLLNEKLLNQINQNIKNLNFEKINLSSKNNFSFKIGKKLKLENLSIESEIEISDSQFKKPTLLIDSFPKVNDVINLKNHLIKLIYKKNNFSLKGSGKIQLEKEFDEIDYAIIRKGADYIIKSNIVLNELSIKNKKFVKNFFPKVNKDIKLKNHQLIINYKKNNLLLQGLGKIQLENELDEIDYSISKINNKLKFDVKLNLDKTSLIIDYLNFKKKRKTLITLIGNYEKNKGLNLSEASIREKDNLVLFKNLFLNQNNKIIKFDKINLDYFDIEGKKNQLSFQRKQKNDYELKGLLLNANTIISDLLKNKNDQKTKIFKNDINLTLNIKEVFIDSENILNNIKGNLIIKDNKIFQTNVSAFFGNNENFTFTINTNNNEKITTLFSSKAKPIVERYKFIKGYEEGSLDFYSTKKNNISFSKLKMYDFKLQELPVLTKLLTLASLQGIADLLSGEGIRFDEFEMIFNNKRNLMTIEEIYAIGPAISILMSGYVEQDKLVSLRGTLVPATTINKTIGSIPILGKILVGSKTGEGVFGVSFKIKGPPKKLETTVNPIKTLTPRFITRTLEKIKSN